MSPKSPTSLDLSRDKLDRLIHQLKRRRGAEAPAKIPRRQPDAGRTPLSSAQERLWFLHRLDPASPAYNLTAAIRFDGLPDAALLRRALAEILHRHESLRTVVAPAGDEEDENRPAQRLLPVERVARIPRIDLGAVPPARADREARRIAVRLARTPFDLVRGPLLRATAIRRPAAASDLILSVHHLVADGWSIGLFTRELSHLGRALAAGRPAALDPVEIQYGDFAAWQRQRLAAGTLDEALEERRARLAGAPSAALPADRPWPTELSGRGAVLPAALGEERTEAIRALGRRWEATPFMVVLAAFHLLLSRVSGEDDLVVGTVVAGRERSELEGIIGFFANTLALRTEVGGGGAFAEILERTRRSVLEAFRYQELPFGALVERLGVRGRIGGSPAHNGLDGTARRWRALVPGGPGRPGPMAWSRAMAEVHSGTAKFALSLQLRDEGDAIRGVIEYSTDLYDRTTVARLGAALDRILAAAVAEPARPVVSFPLLGVGERQQVLVEWSGSGGVAAPFADPFLDGGRTLVDLFARRAAERPDAPALDFPDGAATYGELDRRSARLASALRGRGVVPGTSLRCASCARRSWWSPCSPSARGRHLPLPRPGSPGRAAGVHARGLGGRRPDYPPRGRAGSRRGGGAHPGAGFAGWGGRGGGGAPVPVPASAPGAAALYLRLDRHPEGGADAPPEAGPAGPAGPLGSPGGAGADLAVGPGDRVAQVANASFDAAAWEVWSALTNGACLVGVPRDVVLAPRRLAAELAERSISAVLLTTSVFNQLAREVPGAFAGVRLGFFGGEAADPEAVRRVLAASPPEALVNAYGPTENSVMSTTERVDSLEPDGEVGVDRPADRRQHGPRPRPGAAARADRRGRRAGGRRRRPRPRLPRTAATTAELFVADPFGAPFAVAPPTPVRASIGPGTWFAAWGTGGWSSSAGSITRSRCAACASSRGRWRRCWQSTPACSPRR